MTLSCQNLSSLSHLHVIWIAVKRLHKERINCLLHHDRHCPFAGSAAVENILTNAHTLHKHIHILYTFGQACAHVDIHSNTRMSSFKSMHVCVKTNKMDPEQHSNGILPMILHIHNTVYLSMCNTLSSHIFYPISPLFYILLISIPSPWKQQSRTLFLCGTGQISSLCSKFRLLSNSDRELNSFQSIPVHAPRRYQNQVHPLFLLITAENCNT